MSKHKSSGFFDILKTYAPNYEPKQHSEDTNEKKGKQSISQTEKQPATEKKDPQPQKKHQPSKKKNTYHAQSFDREKTFELEKQRREKNLESYEKWQLVKQTVQEEDTDRLKEKINLQLQLIRCQELAYQQKIQEQENEKAKERERQRALKRAKAQELLEHCKQSLANDRQKKNQQSNTRKRTKSNSTTFAFNTAQGSSVPGERDASKTPASLNNNNKNTPYNSRTKDIGQPDDPPSRLPTKVFLDDAEDEKDLPAVSPSVYDKQRREGTDVSSVASLNNTPTPGKQSPVTREVTTNITREITRASTLPEEDEDYDAIEEQEVDEFAEYPWYQQQLYRLYGKKEADIYLYPKVEAKAKKKTKTLDPRFKNPDGRTGANELWTNLRKESQGKILRVDASIPDDLKVQIAEYRKKVLKKQQIAFSCLARESIAKLKRPIRRSYSVKDDVPEMDQLLDQTVVQDAQNYRHKMELMFRSSQKNEDRFRVLSFNNPIPNLNNATGEESVARYMPSWIEEDYDADTDLSYRKYLLAKDSDQNSEPANKQEVQTSAAPRPDKSKTEDVNKNKGGETQSDDLLPSEWDFMLMRKPTRERTKGNKYMFLTERDTTTPGQFRKRREQLLTEKMFPGAYKLKEGSQSAHYPSVGQSDATVTMAAPSASAYRSGHSAYAVSTEFTLSGREEVPVRSHSRTGILRDFQTWEPLSMHALIEYKNRKETLGSGDYAQGKAPIWNARATVVN